MPVEHSDFLRSAADLASSSETCEMTARNAGSRAYYALYHKAKRLLEDNGANLVKVDNAGSHESLISAIAVQGVKGKSIAESLSRFKRFRNNCDYDLDISISAKKLALQLAEANRLVGMLDRLEINP
ncbi:hypothetical protein [Pseudomonas sp. B10(2017)]|uniref:hypothetical protein n=1 Tax=Pseudomonas sp. B10(2017) TaxID=1981749 RepID=UPI00117A5D36|nr:hypothetical protein [Pseudomonas sp. B10(2017)]